MASSRRMKKMTKDGHSNFDVVERVVHPAHAQQVCRRGNAGARQTHRLDPFDEPKQVRACSNRHASALRQLSSIVTCALGPLPFFPCPVTSPVPVLPGSSRLEPNIGNTRAKTRQIKEIVVGWRLWRARGSFIPTPTRQPSAPTARPVRPPAREPRSTCRRQPFRGRRCGRCASQRLSSSGG